MMLSFIVVWTPYAVESLMASTETELSPFAAVLPTMCCKASPMLNPLILIAASSGFREDMFKACPWLRRVFPLLPCLRHTRVAAMPEVQGDSPAAMPEVQGEPAAMPEVQGEPSTMPKVQGEPSSHPQTTRMIYVEKCTQPGQSADAAAVYYDNEKIFIGDVKHSVVHTQSVVLGKELMGQSSVCNVTTETEHHGSQTGKKKAPKVKKSSITKQVVFTPEDRDFSSDE